MTAPFIPAAQPGQRNSQGFVEMPGGYADAIARFQGGQPQQQAFMPGMPQQQPAPQMPTYQQPAPVAPMQPAHLPAWQPPQNNPMPPQGWPGQSGAPYVPQPQLAPQQPQVLPGQQPQYQPQYQQPGNVPQAPQGADLQQRLSGPGIPAELQGRSLGELIQIHNGLRQIHLQSLAGGSPQSAPAQAPQAQQPAPGQAPGQAAAPAWDWRNPGPAIRRETEDVVTKLFEERLMPALAPVMQNNAIQTIQTARNTAAQHIGVQRFAQLEPLIHQSLAGSDPRALMNPQVWVVAAERAAGMIALNPQLQAQFAGQVRGQVQSGPGIYPVQQVPPGGNPLPNLNTFFSEQPTQGGPGVQQTQLTDTQRFYADQMGIPYAVYAAWSGGQAPAQQNGNGAWR